MLFGVHGALPGIPPGSHLKMTVMLSPSVALMVSVTVRKKFYVLKLDLSKAFDRLEWCFINHILESMGLN